jgi:hypothetical protein
MFCPKCSQQQVSDETRFCSRCGFQLAVVKALLVNDDLSPERTAQSPRADRSLSKRDATIGAFFMFLFALAVAVVTIDMPSSHSARIIGLVVAWFALSLLINIKPIIAYFSHADDPSAAAENASLFKNKSGRASQIENKMQNPALPAPLTGQVVPIADFVMPRGKTAEIVQPAPPPAPPSVTEETTNLLKNN